ncbi:uncharacterized protein SPPG_09460 [Spizellomyces punctatus DAOM BR117]|uniref:Uncharacterized protein n=1 Tax=Spizellomyces punctatus (strain DAOM BR117) TaxID=645134 RepID=A0A0L0H807_SPIPD|nr:uncharacterized protein SPPG_09460 [Spizellomyces punctatus DAOM BR117]KNC97367.1 hypothetical protein SPPG_09460 [Spizellomyces punctatus DAOM BR117]|eukprot:XP_016605407.1 hypothetical protein SPPG_09460 [Spizellomyces punctatus DAOM BR117]
MFTFGLPPYIQSYIQRTQAASQRMFTGSDMRSMQHLWRYYYLGSVLLAGNPLLKLFVYTLFAAAFFPVLGFIGASLTIIFGSVFLAIGLLCVAGSCLGFSLLVSLAIASFGTFWYAVWRSALQIARGRR